MDEPRTDGHYVWPEGLAHYLWEHQVRSPEQFVRHVVTKVESLENAQRDDAW
jgi:hypothetical protein